MIVRRSAAELEKMRRSGLLVYEILQELRSMVAKASPPTIWKWRPRR